MGVYSARLTGTSYLFFEMRIVADLMLKGLSKTDIDELVREQNLFQYRTPRSIKKRLGAIFTRLEVLDQQLLTMLAHGDTQNAKLVALYSILKTDTLFFEFCIEVLREKYLTNQESIDVVDFRNFFSHKGEQSTVVLSWHEYTVYKLRQVYTRILRESGLLKGAKKLTISPTVMDLGLKNHLRQIGEEQFVLAMLGG
ncbi:MAG: DUF1819 family protein [Syntrophomonas sp.]